MAQIAVLNLKRQIVGYAETAGEAREILNPPVDVAGAAFRGMEKVQLPDDDTKNPGLLCFKPHYGMVG